LAKPVPSKILLSLVVAGSLQAGEYAVLTTGFRIHAESHSTSGEVVQLSTNKGLIEIPSNLIAGFEAEEALPAPPPAPVAAAQPPPEIPNEADRKLTPQELITRAALRAGLPPEIVHSVARAESGYRADAVSPKGAIGLMQLMPGTAAALNVDPRDPAQNADGGAMYLRALLMKYEDDPHQVSKAIAAYNAGPAAVDKYHGIPPYRETIEYVNRVLRQYEKERQKTKTGSSTD
jgi:soluble lytic murein transglycosylase-like protein